VIELHVLASVRLSWAVLPQMIDRRDGGIVMDDGRRGGQGVADRLTTPARNSAGRGGTS